METWRRQERAFGLRRKVYVKRAAIRGQQPITFNSSQGFQDCPTDNETDAPWAAWWEKDIADGKTRGPAARLAKMLKQYDIKASRSVRLSDNSTPKGYWRDDFQEAWKRYCPIKRPENATTPQEQSFSL